MLLHDIFFSTTMATCWNVCLQSLSTKVPCETRLESSISLPDCMCEHNVLCCTCHQAVKVKLSPKCNLGFICECIWVKSIITTKESLLRFTVVLFLGKLIFNGVQGHFSASIKITIFKTLRRLDTTWNFARSITRVSTNEHEHWEHCLCTQSWLKREFLDNSN